MARPVVGKSETFCVALLVASRDDASSRAPADERGLLLPCLIGCTDGVMVRSSPAAEATPSSSRWPTVRRNARRPGLHSSGRVAEASVVTAPSDPTNLSVEEDEGDEEAAGKLGGRMVVRNGDGGDCCLFREPNDSLDGCL
mmetsp:Transcript_28073/g.54117  ORF Transcript_28073/g.54117 Transcript_28073/m.54117 type:complete len:141 (+) Transcript_28073:462-884(+)